MKKNYFKEALKNLKKDKKCKCCVCESKNKMVYLKDEKGNYYNEDYHCLVGPLTKDKAEPMTEANAKSIIAKNPTWEMEVKQ